MDAWTEGDGERICRCWKILLLHFCDGGCTKYAWEALRLLFQLKQLSPSLAHQVKWSRFVNCKGGSGHNIPCNLHNEHVNKVIKDIVNNMGGSLTEQAIRQAGQSVTMVHDIAYNFDRVECHTRHLHTKPVVKRQTYKRSFIKRIHCQSWMVKHTHASPTYQ